MEPLQRLGVHAAGLALSDAGLIGQASILADMHMIVACGTGERDIAVDEALMSAMRTADKDGPFLNKYLSDNLRPTLFLAQLPNLLAGNISIIHGVTGSSRTFMGEESAGLDAIATMAARIRAGHAEIGLVGGSYSAPRPDMMLILGFGGSLLRGEPKGVWSRTEQGGGMITGSIGAFLVLEARRHAVARGARIDAVLGPVLSARSDRTPGAVAAMARELWSQLEASLAPGPVAVISGASGVEPVTSDERALLSGIAATRDVVVRASGDWIGHGMEASAPANLGLAALALRHGMLPPSWGDGNNEAPAAPLSGQVVVTSFGHWRGEGLMLVGNGREGVAP